MFGFVTFMSIGGFPSFVEDMKVSLVIVLKLHTQFSTMMVIILFIFCVPNFAGFPEREAEGPL